MSNEKRKRGLKVLRNLRRKKLEKRILVGITGYTDRDWKDKINEIEKLKIRRVALFLERFTKRQREEIYVTLLNSKIREIPLVHIRNDMDREELKFLAKNYKKPCFTIHEDSFQYLDKWQGFRRKLYLEMNYDNHVSLKTRVKKIGGFCVDLAHFKAAEEKWTRDFEYTLKRRKWKKVFRCNHLSGYSFFKNSDLHAVEKESDFDYLKTLPKFVFGKIIAIEVDNPIREQLEYKEYIMEILSSKL
jgi:hypothetical protein